MQNQSQNEDNPSKKRKKIPVLEQFDEKKCKNMNKNELLQTILGANKSIIDYKKYAKKAISELKSKEKELNSICLTAAIILKSLKEAT